MTNRIKIHKYDKSIPDYSLLSPPLERKIFKARVCWLADYFYDAPSQRENKLQNKIEKYAKQKGYDVADSQGRKLIGWAGQTLVERINFHNYKK